MAADELSKQQIKEIADGLERIVKDLPWHQSVFLSALGKKFEQIRDEFIRDAGVENDKTQKQQEHKDSFSLKDGEIEVFVSVYNAQGDDLGHWSRIIGNLINQSISRPTYSEMNQVKEMIRSKQHLNNEGFVSIHIQKSDFLDVPDERLPKDKVGNTLLLLKERVITHSKIKRFYHNSGIYEYNKGLLTRLSDMKFTED